MCTPLDSSDVQVITKQLVKPFIFTYVKGLVNGLVVCHEEPYWSVNVKRGLISMMQLNLLEVDTLSDVPPQIFDDVKYSQESKRTALHKFYRTMEQDLVGDCESLYAIADSLISPEPRLYVNKVRNYDTCTNMPSMPSGIFTNFDCPACQEEKVMTF